MKIRSPWFVLVLLVLAAAGPARADIAIPDNRRPRAAERIRTDLPSSHLTIESRAGLREARLQVPRKLLGQLAPQSGSAALSADSAAAPRPLHTVVAGVFLSLSFVSAGLLLVRSRRQQTVGRFALIASVCVVPLAAAVVALANAAPPPLLRPLDAGTLRKAVPNGKALAGAVRLEIVEDGDEIKLLVPAGGK